MNPWFDPIILIAIILNTVMLAMDQYPEMDADAQNVLQIFNWTFTFVFTVEVILKMIGLGLREYIYDRLN